MISSYEYVDPIPGSWHFGPADFAELNLLVGASGSGKTRFLNTLFNLASFISKSSPLRPGKWVMMVVAGGCKYSWTCESVVENKPKTCIKREILKIIYQDETDETLIDRTMDSFVFRGTSLPKLSRDISGISLLKEEAIVQPLYRIFPHTMRRSFHAEGLQDAVAVQSIGTDLIDSIGADQEFEKLFHAELALSAKLFVLHKHLPQFYDLATQLFMEVFPSVKQCKVVMTSGPISGSSVPIFQVKEKGVDPWLPLHDLSSGMQKVLLIITDVLTLPKNSVYIIDEYENSLGVNAIDFLPTLLAHHAEGSQYFITTHHPYLINNMPITTWRVFTRVGSEVRITSGRDLESRYGKSKQQAFVQLINDPLYNPIDE